jgi:hypothetical protein
MIPFCNGVSAYRSCQSTATYRVVEILDLLHQLHHGLVLAVADVWLLSHTEAMFGTDAAVPLLNPLVHKRLELLLHSLVESSCGNVQVQVGIAHVAVANDVDNGVVGTIANETSFSQTVPSVVDDVVELRDRNRQIVLVDTTLVAENLCDALSP